MPSYTFSGRRVGSAAGRLPAANARSEEAGVLGLDAQKIGRALRVPLPIAGARRMGLRAAAFIERGRERAAVKQRDEVAAGGLVPDGLRDQQRHGIEGDVGSQFVESARAYAVGGGFLKADDAAGNVPSRAAKLVIAPGEERAGAVVLYEQVDVDERRPAAEREEDLLGEPAAGVGEGGFHGGEGGAKVHRGARIAGAG